MIVKSKKIFNLIIMALITMFLPTFTYAATSSSLMDIVREMIAKWYFIFRYFSIALMLVALIILGIKMAITSIAEKKAKYKRMLVDWLIGFIIIFTIHYFMIFVLTVNEKLLSIIQDISGNIATRWVTAEEANLGLNPSTQGLYEMVRTRAYELRFTLGTSGMIMYMVLVYYTVKFAIIYFKRFFTVLILTIMAPIMGLMYAFNKILSGKAITLKKWASEYTFNVLLQTMHALVYGIFVQLAVALSTQSIVGFVLAMVMLSFITKGDQLLRKILKLSGGLVDDNANKGIKENMAALTAMAASANGIFNSDIVKDIGNGVKDLIGGAAVLGVRGGMVGYDKVIDDLLDKKKQKKEEEEKSLKEEQLNKLTAEKDRLAKEKEIKDRIAKLDKSIKNLEQKQELKNKRLKGFRGGIKDPEALQKYLDEKTKNIYDPELKRKEQQKLREKNNNDILKRVKIKNKQTGEVEISGIGAKISKEINTAIWGNNTVKDETKDLIKTTASGIAGMFMTIASVPMIVTEPAIGLGLLAKGRKNSKKLFSNDDYRKITNFGERNAIRAGQRIIRKRQREEINEIKKERKTIRKQRKVLRKTAKQVPKGTKLSFNRLNPRSLETISAQMKMDAKLNSIRKMNSLTLGNIGLTSAFRLTGTLGAARTIQSKAYKIQEARKDYFENIETFEAIEKKDSINKDFITDYNIKINGISSRINSKSDSEIMEKFREDSGRVITVGNTKFQFGKDVKAPSNPTEIKGQIIDNVLLKVAARNKVFDIKDLNLKSSKVQTQLAEEFRKVGVLNDTINPEEFKIDKTVSLNLDKLKDRVNIIAKENPKAVEETIAKDVIAEYMQVNNIVDVNEIKKDEHKEKIKEEILGIIEETEESKSFEMPKANSSQATNFSEIINSSVESFEKDRTMRTMDISKPTEEVTSQKIESVLDGLGPNNEVTKTENSTTYHQVEDAQIQDTRITEVKNPVNDDIQASKTSIEMYSFAKPEDISRKVERLDNVIKTQEKNAKKEERIELFEDLITSLEESKPSEINKVVTNETLAEERKRQVQIEKGEIDSQLEGFERIINEDLDDTKAIENYIENETSPEVDELLSQLLALKEQDMVGVALNFKPNSFEQKRMNTIDLDRINSTYKKKI